MSRRRLITVAVTLFIGAIVIAFVYLYVRPGPVATTASDGTVLLTSPDRHKGSFAGTGISGQIVVKRSCVGLTTPAGVRIVIWPRGTKIHSSPLSVEVDGKEYRVGDTFSGGGDEAVPASEVDYMKRIPETCRVGKYMVLQPE